MDTELKLVSRVIIVKGVDGNGRTILISHEGVSINEPLSGPTGEQTNLKTISRNQKEEKKQQRRNNQRQMKQQQRQMKLKR